MICMGLPAEIRATPLEGVSDLDRQRLGEEMAALIEDWRSTRPTEGSPGEAELIQRWLVTASELAPVVVGPLFERGLSGWARDLTAAQLDSTTSTERQLAVRWLWRAFETMERLLAVAEQAMRGGPDVLSRVIVDIASAAPTTMDSDSRRVVSFELDFFVALELLGGADPTELAFFSQRAYRTGIKVESLLNTADRTRLRGEFVRERARRAWEEWEEEDLVDEFAQWPANE